MKIKEIMFFALLLLLGFTTQSCNDNDNDKSASRMIVTKDGVEVSNIDFTIAANSAMVGIITDGDWTVSSSDESWCTLDVHAGYGYADSLKTSYTRVRVTKNEGEARSANITFQSGNISKTVTINQKGSGTDPGDTFESAFTFVENLKMGYNLGNTLDSNHDPATCGWDFNPQTPIDWETCWGQPETTQEIIDAIVAKGFNIIRVPVTWFPHVDSDWNIDEAWMNRVHQVVDMVLQTGSYCILNVMHDVGQRTTTRQDKHCWLTADMDSYAENTLHYQKLWQQIATSFRDYDDKLVFECFNEILNASYSWTAPAAGSSDYETIRRLEQDFVNTVRNTGGNNEFRNLIINPYAASSTQVAIDEISVPTDMHSNHILMSVHSYDPYWFCNDTSDKSAQQYYIYNFDTDCQTTIDDMFVRLEKRCSDLGIPYIFGEFGAIGSHVDIAERIKYARYLSTKMKSVGTSGLWWMGLIDRATLNWYELEIANALFENIQ